MALGCAVGEGDADRAGPRQWFAAPAAAVAAQDLDHLELVVADEALKRGRGLSLGFPLYEAAVNGQSDAQLRGGMKRPSRARNEVGTSGTSGTWFRLVFSQLTFIFSFPK